MKRLLPLAPLALLLLITMGVGPCDSKPLGSADGCMYNGKTYAAGVTFPASDGCNTCSCENAMAACSLLACTDAGQTCFDNSGKVIPCKSDGGLDGGGADGGGMCFDTNGKLIPCATDGGSVCSYGGKTYAIGASFPCMDGCNTCSCTANGVTGTTKGCVDGSTDAPPPSCYYVDGTPRACGFDAGVDCLYGNTFYPVNSSFPSTDGCNKCTCTASLTVACTETACADGGVQCVYAGKPYPVGASFPEVGGCNTCTCTAGGMVACTLKACVDGGLPTEGGMPADGGSDGAVMCFDMNGKVIPCAADGGPTGVCTLGADQSCNDDPMQSSIIGKCRPDLTCDCGMGAINPMTGRCIPPTTTPTGCSFEGVTYPLGSKFMCSTAPTCSTDICYCAPPGEITALCSDGPLPVCGFDAAYTYGRVGGLVTYSDQVTLTPPASYVLVRTAYSNGSTAASGSCGPALPACNSGPIDVSDIMRDISDPTVQLLISLSTMSPTLLGVDQRPFDGTVFSFKKSGTAGFLVGASCAGAANCTEIPPAVTTLVADLQKLDAQQSKDPSCASFQGKM